jgi:hypothetical protein
MKTTTALVPPAPRPIGPGGRLRLRPLGPRLQPRAHADARTSRTPGPQRRLPAAALPRRAGHHPAGPLARLFPPETRP